MNAVSLIQSNMSDAHAMMLDMVRDLTFEEAVATHEGSTIGSIASIFTHVAVVDDMLVHRVCAGRPMILEQDGWAARLGAQGPRVAVNSPESWETMREYAAVVFASSDLYINGLNDADLDREVVKDGVLKQIGVVLNSNAAFHIIEHIGEIAALRGLLGKQGLSY